MRHDRFYAAAQAFADCWTKGWEAESFTLWKHVDVRLPDSRWHVVMAVRAASGFESWIQVWSKGRTSPAGQAFLKRLSRRLRKRGYRGTPARGLFRKSLRTLPALKREWFALSRLRVGDSPVKA